MGVRVKRGEGVRMQHKETDVEGKQEADGHGRQGFEGCAGVGREFA